jgi:hypothetical protein
LIEQTFAYIAKSDNGFDNRKQSDDEKDYHKPVKFEIKKARNQITGDGNYEQIYVTFDEPLHAEQFYRMQPYF